MRGLLVTIGCLAAASAAPAFAQRDTAVEARAILEQFETFQDTETFRLVGEPRAMSFSNATDDEDGETFEFAIDPKKDYRLVGYCDAFCELDLVAETANGDDVGEDRRGDFIAYVDVEPNKSGSKVKAKVIPGHCTRRGSEACVAGVALFEVLQRRRN